MFFHLLSPLIHISTEGKKYKQLVCYKNLCCLLSVHFANKPELHHNRLLSGPEHHHVQLLNSVIISQYTKYIFIFFNLTI